MISLKTYNREIEQLIDNGLYDDAIAHSVHILSTYPKCIESYRNLGKSLLEQKKYPEALDVFSRVLSAIPDDFISHVGLSIIVEDQNNLDLAIWHMEQAFDVQPSNLAIQDELKRLFGRRDGEQPSKIRLTRGALVRMYARGELFQQAITEILSILEEDPRRIDLEVILARMHYSSGAIDEAEADCNRILEKFPFCFEANRILQQIHLTKNNSEAATINKNRLISLDPYYQFITSPFSDNEIPENKVQLDKLEVIPSNNFDSHIPEWFDEIDQSKEFKPGEPFNWANDLSKAEEPNANPLNAPFSVEDQDLDNSDVNNIQTDDEIPEWIKSAGWNSNSEFASEETNKSITAAESDKELEISEVRVNDSQTEKSTNVSNDDLALLFTELKEGKMDDENLVSNGNEEKQFPPSEWMSQFSNSDASTSQQPSDQDFPDWLKNFQAEEPQNSESSEDMPDWLKNLQTEPESVSQSSDNELTDTSIAEFEPEETTFDNIFDHEFAPEVTSSIDDTPQALSDQDDGWEKIDLSSNIIQESQTPNIETGELKPISSDDEIPDWVKSVLITQNVADDVLRDEDVKPDFDTLPASDEQLKTTSVFQGSSEESSNLDNGIISQQTNDELLDWLRGLKTPDEPSSLIEEPSNSLETTVDDEIEKDQELILEAQLMDDLQLPKDVSVNLFDSELNDQSVDQPREETELISEKLDDSIQTNFADVEFTEYANEMTETATQSNTVELDTPLEVQQENITESKIENSIADFSELLDSDDFETLSTIISKQSLNAQEVEQVVAQIKFTELKNSNNFDYWQCLGDIFSKNNQLSEALSAYQKAEDILLKSISS